MFTEGSTCSAAQPGTINKGTVSGGVITLTASGTPGTGEVWYWQGTADGTATTESGATKNVTTAGTYYIRSYKASETCWSAATSVTVEEEDFYTPCGTPDISVHPNSAEATYNRGDAATALSVTASVSDGGTLSYQWYSNTTATNTGGTLISGATSADYTPSTAVAGTLYYYCVVTNTLAGHSPVSATSNVSGAIIVNSSCPAPNSGVVLYKFEVNSSVSDGNICSSGNNPVQLTEPTQLSTLIGGTLEGWISSGTSWNNLAFNGGRITYANNDKGVLIITLDCPIEEGDLIRFNNYSSSNDKYNYLRHTSYSTSANQLTLPASRTATQIQSVVAPAAFAGKTELFIVPGARTTGISYFEIIRSCPVLLDANTNGGKVGGEDTKTLRGAIGDELALLHAFKDGYRFKGWFDAPSGGVAVSNPYTITGPTTLYAQFEDCPDNGLLYKFEVGTGLTNGSVTANGVDFDFNTANYLSSIIGGTLTTGGSAASKVTITGNNAITITDNAAYLKVDLDCALEEGDVFQSTVSGNTVYVSKATSRTKTAELAIGTMVQTPIPATLAGEKTLYIWKGSGSSDALTYFEITRPRRTAITLDATGAYNNYTTSVTAVLYNEMPEIHTLPMRVGYVFGGYYDEPDGAGTQYYNGLGEGVRNWDKDVTTATLYAKWSEPCDLAPTLTNTVPVATIWDRQEVDMSLVQLSCDFDTTGIQYSLVSASEAIPGCTFKYFDERIYIHGTPAIGNTSTVSKTITFTMTNDCSPAHTYTVDATIRIYPAGQKAKIAFIITGTKGGAFDAYETDDASSCNALVTYLSSYYDITYVNGYATKDETAIANYYKDYDLMVVTDFLDTGEGYTNALGTMIDKKPILSFEAYVANQSNWHIGSNPKDPHPKVKDMKILCAGHAIFGNAKYDPGDAEETVVVRPDTTVNVLSTLSSADKAKGLQGFTINEAPDFIFLATVRDADNNRDLIVCCERQVVFPARLLLYGINFYEMPNLSKSGKIIMKQMIDYLLMTDETKVADCSLVFDNGAGNPNPGGGNHLWNNPANWAPGYNIIPTPYHPTRIIAECWVNVDNAHAGSVKVNKGRDEHGNVVDGKLIVRPYGGLTVAGIVAKVNDTRYASPITIKAEDLLIEADATHNGAFVYGNKESDVRATVQYYSRAEGAQTAKPVWQYIGIPFQASKTAINMYYEAWMCRWSNASDGGLGGLWQWVDNNDVLVPFEGYCITQESKKTYSFTGKLNAPVTTTIELDNYDPADGFAFAANSWTAPIKIQQMQDEDFTNADKAIYIYHTGSYAQWGASGEPVNATTGAVSLPGQYAVIPIHSSPYLAGADSVIPAMQGFFVKTTGAGASIQLVYNRVVYDATYFKTSTQPMRSPRRDVEESGEPGVMRMVVSGQTSGGDQIHILTRSDFSETFEDGWDGRKIAGDTAAPYLAVVKQAGEMAVASIAEYEGRNLSFRAGEDIEYTFTFNYDGDEIYLYDRETEQATLIRTGNTYTFSAVNKTPENRFLITANPPRTPTDLENTEYRIQNTEPKKFIYEDKLLIFYRGVIYDALGAPVKTRKETAQ
ncbi:MAG: InlB B-repeat-containing protein [Paludibacteraceae bacterium]|nr:InlB B-repeat-containing protein [Paludibacteraceae bacterium]